MDLSGLAQLLLKKPATSPMGNDLPSQGGLTGNQWLQNLPALAQAPVQTQSSQDLPVVGPPPSSNTIAPANITDLPQVRPAFDPHSTINKPYDSNGNPYTVPNDLPVVGPPVQRQPLNNDLPTVGPNFQDSMNQMAGMVAPGKVTNPDLPPVGQDLINQMAGSVVNGSGAVLPERQRVVPYKQLSQDDQIGQDSKEYQDLQKNPLPIEPKLWKRLLAGLANGLAHGNPQNGLGGMLGSALGGAAVDTFSPKAEAEQRTNDELQKVGNRLNTNLGLRDRQLGQQLKQAQIDLTQNKPAMAREALRAKVEAATAAQQRRLEVINRQADIKSGEAKLYTDEDGYQWKKYLKPDSSGKLKPDEPVVNPTTGQQEQLPGMEQVDWTDPNTGVVTKQRAKDVLMPGATIAAGNATRQQQAATHNSGQAFEAQKTNAASMTAYNNNVLSHAEKILAAQGKSTESVAKVQGMNDELQALTQQLGNYDDNNDYDGKQRNALIEKIAAKNTEVQTALGQMDAGSDALEQMRKENIQKPQMVKAVPIQAVKVGGGVSNTGKPVPKSKDPFNLYQ